MMQAFSILRHVDAQRIALETAARSCSRRGAEVRWKVRPGKACYLRFKLGRADGVLLCSVSLRTWLRVHWPDIEGLAWEQCDDRDLHRLVTASAPPIGFECPSLRYERSHFLGRLDIQDEGDVQPCLRSREGDIWVEQCDGAPPSSCSSANWLSPLVLPIDYRIGAARLPARRVTGLRIHDIVLFELAHGTANFNEQSLFHFNFNTEHIVVDDILSNIEIQQADEAGETSAGVDVSTLSVSIDVVLCRMQQTLGELSDLQPGATLPLAEGAHRSVRLMVGRQCVATGEVVQIGERLGVQIESVMSRS
jgi:type III secretion protein Q